MKFSGVVFLPLPKNLGGYIIILTTIRNLGGKIVKQGVDTFNYQIFHFNITVKCIK